MIPWLKRPRDPRHILGVKGEALAVRHLRREGFRILERNFCAADGEIDIIAEREGAVHFVEVKSRLNDEYGAPEESIQTEKQRKIRRAAQVYLSQFRLAPQKTSFDSIGIIFDTSGRVEDIRWTPSAF